MGRVHPGMSGPKNVRGIVATESILPSKLKIFTVLPFIEKKNEVIREQNLNFSALTPFYNLLQ